MQNRITVTNFLNDVNDHFFTREVMELSSHRDSIRRIIICWFSLNTGIENYDLQVAFREWMNGSFLEREYLDFIIYIIGLERRSI